MSLVILEMLPPWQGLQMQKDTSNTTKKSGKQNASRYSAKITSNDKHRGLCLGKDKQVHKTGWGTGQEATLLKVPWN